MTRYNLVKNVANQSAFEAARIGVKPGTTAQEVEAEARQQMQYVCDDCSVVVTPSVITSQIGDKFSEFSGATVFQIADSKVLATGHTIRQPTRLTDVPRRRNSFDFQAIAESPHCPLFNLPV